MLGTRSLVHVRPGAVQLHPIPVHDGVSWRRKRPRPSGCSRPRSPTRPCNSTSVGNRQSVWPANPPPAFNCASSTVKAVPGGPVGLSALYVYSLSASCGSGHTPALEHTTGTVSKCPFFSHIKSGERVADRPVAVVREPYRLAAARIEGARRAALQGPEGEPLAHARGAVQVVRVALLAGIDEAVAAADRGSARQRGRDGVGVIVDDRFELRLGRRAVETRGALGRGLRFELGPCVGDLRRALGDRGVVLCGVARARELGLGLLPARRVLAGRLVLPRLALLHRVGGVRDRVRRTAGLRYENEEDASRAAVDDSIEHGGRPFVVRVLVMCRSKARARSPGAPFPGSTHRPTRSSFHKREKRGRRILSRASTRSSAAHDCRWEAA